MLAAFGVLFEGPNWLALTAEEQRSGNEERGAGAAEENDGVAVGSLYGGGSGARAVEALGAALSVGGGCQNEAKTNAKKDTGVSPLRIRKARECSGRDAKSWLHGRDGEFPVRSICCSQTALHCPNSSRRKRKIQRAPMTCQYQTVVSTKTWRVESERENFRADSATMRPTMPRKRCTAWVMVMR